MVDLLDVPNSGPKIVFICDTITPGRGGVGDYTVALATELTRQGHTVAVASLMEHNDAQADYPFPHIQLKAAQNWAEKQTVLSAWLQKIGPDVISLQYVPYAYHPRGLPIGLSRWLKGLHTNARFHVMFHELWVAAEQGATFKNCIIGCIQKQMISRMLRMLDPVAIHTTNPVYQSLLARLNVKADLLPLFSNIQPVEQAHSPWERLQSKGFNVNADNRNTWLISELFGTLHPSWDPWPAVQLLQKAADIAQKRPALVLAGHNGPHAEVFQNEMAQRFPEITVVSTGKLDIPELSGVLRIPDFGVSASPWALSGKSSASLALLSHGVPVVFTNDTWRLRKGPTPLPTDIDGCYLNTAELPQRIADGLPTPKATTPVEGVATILYQSINTALASQ